MNKKKALTILGIIACISFICGIIIFIILDGRGKTNTPTTDNEVDGIGEGMQDEVTITPTPIPDYEYDREVIVKDTTLIDRDPSEYIVSDVQDLNQETYYLKTQTTFSNGIAVQSTKYITAGMYTGERIECIGDDGVTIIHVSEINPLDYTPERKKQEYLNEYWQAYVAYEGKEFKREDTELGTGLNENVNAYNKSLGEDPTITDGVQLLMNSTIETAIGEGYILIEYSQYSKKFTLHAYVDCGDYRYLEITIDSINEDTLLGYLHDLMNNGVYIIE